MVMPSDDGGHAEAGGSKERATVWCLGALIVPDRVEMCVARYC